jgi:hypothetical protein
MAVGMVSSSQGAAAPDLGGCTGMQPSFFGCRVRGAVLFATMSWVLLPITKYLAPLTLGPGDFELELTDAKARGSASS